MTTTIYLIRHGEVYNPKGILYGRLPRYGLSPKGKKEIEQTADFLKNKRIDLIYASPLLRARQTAEIIRSNLKLPKIFISKYILEVNTSYQGRLLSSLHPEQTKVYDAPKPNDETLEIIAKRMQTFIKQISKTHAGKNIVVVSHGDPLMLLRAVLNGRPAEYASVRTGNGFSYIKHGEIIALTIHDNGKIQTDSIFKPDLN